MFLTLFFKVVGSETLILTRSIYEQSLTILFSHFATFSSVISWFIDFSGLQNIPGFQLTYQLTRHSALEKVVHLFPENALIGGDDIVPGVREGPPDGRSLCSALD